MMEATAWLPALVTLESYGGNWHAYVEAVYKCFCNDFVHSRPQYHGKRLALKRHPLMDGKEATFWHVVSEGKVESERVPDLRRCERIRWPRPIIVASGQGILRCWRSVRGRDLRIVIAVDDFSYVVVLADRGEYVMLWTAYPVEEEHRRRKLRREYESYTGAFSANAAREDGVVTPSTYGG